jgi:cytochrome c oxidase subunit 3/cytochrome o ubiquinol oxidase subunit 3
VSDPNIATGPSGDLAAAARPLPVPPPIVPEETLSPAQWGVLAFLLSEVAFFGTLIVTYLNYLGKTTEPPTPATALSLPLVVGTTICLLASSGTVHLAERNLRQDRQSSFRLWWGLTIALGVVFLLGTAYEWYELITRHHLTISRNLFGTTYYTLVGFHALHVTGGVIAMSIILGLAVRRHITARNAIGAEMVAWYWHFVDGVWIVVFLVVYVLGR